MNKLLISLLLIACNFAVSPVKAQIDFEQRTTDLNMGKNLGWLEATCFYVVINVLSESLAKEVIAVTIKRPVSKNKIYERMNNGIFLAFVKDKHENKACRKLFPPNFFN